MHDVHHAIRTPDGIRRILSVNATPITNDRGEFDGMVAALSDITASERARHELAESRTRLRMLLSQLPAVAWSVDRELRFTSISGAALTALDPPPQIGDDLAASFGRVEDFLPVVLAHRAALTGEPSTYGYWWADAWWQVAIEPMRNDDGDIVGVIGLGFDGTRERRAVEEAERQRARYRSLFDRSGDAIVLVDDNGSFVDLNPAATALIGASADELIGTSVDDVAADVSPGLQGHFGELTEHLREHDELSGEMSVSAADGGVRDLAYEATADVQPGVHMFILRDVTEQRRFERALAASEEQFRSLAEAAAEGIFRIQIHPVRRTEYANPALERITGFRRDEMVHDPDLLRNRTHPDDRHTADRLLDRPVDIRFEHADGRQRWLQIHQTRVVGHDGHAVALVGITRDITDDRRRRDALAAALDREQRAAERLRQLDELKNGFLRAVSHELRTPLTSVYGIAATIHDNHDRLTDERSVELLGRLLVNAERLRSLLTDLLDVNRLTHHEITPARQQVDLATLVREVADASAFRDHDLSYDLRPTPSAVEPATTRRVIHNLLANAERHTPRGTTIHLRTHLDPSGDAHLVVEDDGPGLPVDLGDTIFEPFVQGPDTATAAQPGTGIGLSLVRQFVLLHGGTIEASNRPEGGARFHVTLPAQHDPEPAPASADPR